MTVDSIVREGRVAAESRMTDACTIGVASGPPVWDPVTETYTTPTTVDYAGKCRVKAAGTQALEPDAGDTTSVVISPSVHIPADVGGITVGAVVTITAAQFNPSLEGVAFRVTSLFRDSQATAQRLDCTEVQ